MQDFLTKSSYAANITSGKALMRQEGGYLSAGGGFIRTPVKNLQLLHVHAPSYRMGCSGIDLFFGGLDFVSSEKLTQFGQNVMQNAVPFAIDLALQTWAPGLKGALDVVKKMAQEINSASKSSCEIAQMGVGGVAGWFAKSGKMDFLCQTYASHGNGASSWLASKQGCTDPNTNREKNEAAKKDPSLKDMVTQNRNLVWYFLMKNDFLKTNIEIAQYIMAMTGTVVNIAENGTIGLKSFEPLITNEKTAGLDQILNGNPKDGKAHEVLVYVCDDAHQEKCLSPTAQEASLKDSAALVPNVQKALEAIGEKVLSNEGLTEAEQNLINSVNFPMLRLIENHVSAGWEPEYHSYAEILARIILADYLNQIITQARFVLTQHDLGKDKEIRRLLNNLKQIQTLMVNKMATKAYERLQQQSNLLMRSLELEKIVVGEMSAQTQANYYFGHTN